MDTKEQVLEFLEKCEELKNCKFIMATAKIKDILKCIVNCPELYHLFSEVTKNFNYLLMRSKCLVNVNDGVYGNSYCVLPNDINQRLAFCFCLFVEFDKDTLNFNEFLRIYFPEDGSYFASYHAFCNTVVSGLQDAIAEVFRDELSKPSELPAEADGSGPAKSGMLSALNLSISEEKQFISANASIPEEEKEGALEMLDRLFEALKNENVGLINALIFGYNYFVLYNRCASDGIASLIREITAYEQLL